jgi:hypothetical protein
VVTFIRSFLKLEKKEEDKFLIWVLFAPLFLLLTLFLIPSRDFALWSVAFLGFFLSWKLKRKGMIIALLVLVMVGVYEHLKMETHFWRFAIEASLALAIFIWNFSLEHLAEQIASLGTHRANLLQNLTLIEEEMRRADSFHLQQQKTLQENGELLQKDLQEKKEKISSIELLVRTLKRALIEEKKEKESLLIQSLEAEKKARIFSFEFQELKKDYDAFLQKNPLPSLVDDLNRLREEKYQEEIFLEGERKKIEERALVLAMEKESAEKKCKENQERILLLEKKAQEILKREEELLEKVQEKEKDLVLLDEANRKKMALLEEQLQDTLAHANEKQTIEKLQAELQKLQKAQKGSAFNQKHYEEWKTLQSLYHQLKSQFKEKGLLLHQTRKEVFSLSEQLQTKEREERLQFADEPVLEKQLMLQAIEEEESHVEMEKENLMLEELIGHLSVQISLLSLPKKRGRKKKELNDQELLFKNS